MIATVHHQLDFILKHGNAAHVASVINFIAIIFELVAAYYGVASAGGLAPRDSV